MAGASPGDGAAVDLHTHYYTDTFLQAVQDAPAVRTYRRRDGRLVALWRGGVALTVPDPHPGVEARLEMMDEVGISMQVLSVPSPNAYFLESAAAARLARAVNEELADIRRRHPDRFDALAMLPLQDTAAALDTLDHALGQLEMAGVMILTNIDGLPLDDARLEPFWEAADDRRLLVYVHPTVPDANRLDEYALAIAVGFFADSNAALARLAYAGVFERHPGIRWVFSHLGGTIPFMLPRLDSYWHQFPECRERAPRPPSEYLRALVYDTATTHTPALRCACETFGADRLVFGSDYPHVPGGTRPYLEALDATGTTGAARAELVAGRARSLLAGAHL